MLPGVIAAGAATAGSGLSLASVGSFMSGASSFLNGLGIGGKQKRGPSYQDQLAMQHGFITNDIRSRVQAAKDNGLHPLTTLGVPTASGPSFSMDGSRRGVDLEAMGQGVDRMANAGRTNIQRKLDELALEQAQLSNDYLRVQIAGAQKAITRSGATVPLNGTSGAPTNLVDVVPDQQISKSSKDSGVTAGKHASWRVYDLGNGLQMEAPYNEEGWAEAIGELPWWYKHPKMAEAISKRMAPELYRKKYSKKWLAPWDPRRWKK